MGLRAEELDAIRETANQLQRIKEKQDGIKDLMRDFTIKTSEEAWLELANELEARGILMWFREVYRKDPILSLIEQIEREVIGGK